MLCSLILKATALNDFRTLFFPPRQYFAMMKFFVRFFFVSALFALSRLSCLPFSLFLDVFHAEIFQSLLIRLRASDKQKEKLKSALYGSLCTLFSNFRCGGS